MSRPHLSYISTISRQVELDEMENGPAVQDALLASSGQRTVRFRVRVRVQAGGCVRARIRARAPCLGLGHHASGQHMGPWLGLGLAPLDPSPLALRVAPTSNPTPHPSQVPNVFIGGVHLGGNDDTQAAAASGKLQEMLGL